MFVTDQHQTDSATRMQYNIRRDSALRRLTVHCAVALFDLGVPMLTIITVRVRTRQMLIIDSDLGMRVSF